MPIILPNLTVMFSIRKGRCCLLRKISSKKRDETYKAALDKMAEKHVGRQLVQIKLDAIGGALEEKVDTVTADKK